MELKRWDLAYLVSNPGGQQAMLFLHGFPDNAHVWKKVLAQMESSSPSTLCLAPFAPGTHEDDEFDVRAFSLERYTQALVKVVASHEIRDLIVVGHDMGGLYLEALAAAIPQVRALVYVDTMPARTFLRRLKGPRQWLQSSYMLLFQIPVQPKKRLGALYPALKKIAMQYAGMGGGSEGHEGGAECLNGMGFYRALAKDIVLGALPGAFEKSPVPSVRRYFVWGKGDRVISALSDGELERYGASLKWVGTGHWPMLTDPTGLCAHLLSIQSELKEGNQ